MYTEMRRPEVRGGGMGTLILPYFFNFLGPVVNFAKPSR